ncbi:MAG: nucleotide exchange factor GrpE [Microcoleaceae cyanobacterium]
MNQNYQDEMNPNSTTETSRVAPGSEGGAVNIDPQAEAQTPELEFSAESPDSSTAASSVSQAEDVRETDGSEQGQVDFVSLARANELLNTQLEDINGQYRRLAADFENFRKRSQKEKEELEVRIKSTTIQKLLPVVDSFERARSHIKPESEGEMTIHKSYQGVYKQMVDCLKQVGVSVMRPEGEMFNPSLHEAVMREPTDQHPEGTVIEELVRGYIMEDRVLRHAMVKVAAPLESDESEPTPEG